MEDFLRIGVIIKPHGIKGEVKIFPTTDDPLRFKDVGEVVLCPGKDSDTQYFKEGLNAEITGVRFFKNLVIAKFKGVDTPEEALKIRGLDIMIDRKYALPLADGEYYIADLLGCRVVTEENEELGVIKDVLQTGANDVYVVEASALDSMAPGKSSIPRKKEILLPVIPECIRSVDVEEGIIKVRLMPGLLDL